MWCDYGWIFSFLLYTVNIITPTAWCWLCNKSLKHKVGVYFPLTICRWCPDTPLAFQLQCKWNQSWVFKCRTWSSTAPSRQKRAGLWPTWELRVRAVPGSANRSYSCKSKASFTREAEWSWRMSTSHFFSSAVTQTVCEKSQSKWVKKEGCR